MSSFLGTSRTCYETTSRRFKTERPSTGVVSLTSQFQFQSCIIIKETLKISSGLKQVESSLQNQK